MEVTNIDSRSDATANEANGKTVEVYPTKVDAWIAVSLMMGPLIAGILGVVSLIQQKPDDAMVLFLTGAGTLIFSLLLIWPCRYTLTEDSLSIRMGLMSWRVSYDEIESVELSSSLISGPSLSLSRLKISTKKKAILISPVNREQFMQELDRRRSQ